MVERKIESIAGTYATLPVTVAEWESLVQNIANRLIQVFPTLFEDGGWTTGIESGMSTRSKILTYKPLPRLGIAIRKSTTNFMYMQTAFDGLSVASNGAIFDVTTSGGISSVAICYTKIGNYGIMFGGYGTYQADNCYIVKHKDGRFVSYGRLYPEKEVIRVASPTTTYPPSSIVINNGTALAELIQNYGSYYYNANLQTGAIFLLENDDAKYIALNGGYWLNDKEIE